MTHIDQLVLTLFSLLTYPDRALMRRFEITSCQALGEDDGIVHKIHISGTMDAQRSHPIRTLHLPWW